MNSILSANVFNTALPTVHCSVPYTYVYIKYCMCMYMYMYMYIVWEYLIDKDSGRGNVIDNTSVVMYS